MCFIYFRYWHTDLLTLNCEKIDQLQKTEDMNKSSRYNYLLTLDVDVIIICKHASELLL